jgi:hypothetical protein
MPKTRGPYIQYFLIYHCNEKKYCKTPNFVVSYYS